MQKSIVAERTAAGLGIRRSHAALTIESLTPYALWTLLAAGLGELFLYRMLSRVGVHIPKQGAVLDVYDALVQVGSFAFDVSSVVVFAALALLVVEASHGRARTPLAAAAPALALAFAAVSLLLAFVSEGESAKLAYGLLSAGLMVTLAVLALSDREAAAPRKALVALVVVAYLFAQYYTLSNQAYRVLDMTSVPPLTSRALEAAEALVVAAAVIAFWCWSGVRRGLTWRPSPLQLGAAALLVTVFLGA
ncbi:MAG TPA: hypothetical protein VFX28_00295, partial [Methylomirabilota bacterium]|nr:hypothetical protein [Methylomirabilota bacterium]